MKRGGPGRDFGDLSGIHGEYPNGDWYERFAPQGPDGQLDVAAGVRQFIVGTGGSYRMTNRDGRPAHSEAHFDDAFGVLELTLRDGGYDLRFVPEAGMETRVDSGSDVCH